MITILVVEYAQLKDFKKLWLECDSSLFCQTFCFILFLGFLKIDGVNVYIFVIL